MSVLDAPERSRPADLDPLPGAQRPRACWSGAAIGSTALVLVVLGLGAANPGLVIAGLTASLASVLRRSFPIDVAVPLAALCLFGAATIAGVGAAVAGVNLLTHAELLAGVQVAVAVAAVPLAARRGTALSARRSFPALLPALIAMLTAVWQTADASVAKAWAFWGTDFAHHMVILRGLQETGRLDYSEWLYPRALHMMGALASVPNVPVDDTTELLDYNLRLTGFLTWFSLAILLCTGAALLVRIGDRLGLSSRLTTIAALVFGAAVLGSNSFFAAFVFLGAAPSLLAVAALWAFPLLWMTPPRCAVIVLPAVWGAAFMTVAHTWQALVLVPVMATAAAMPRLGDLLRVVRSVRRRNLTLASAILIFLIAVASLPIAAAADPGGTAVAGIPGDLIGPNWIVVVVTLASGMALARHWTERWVRVLLGGALGHIALIGVLLHSAGGGLDLGQWYPLKAVWFLTLSLAPVAALLLSWCAAAAWQGLNNIAVRTPHPFIVRSSVAAVTIAVAVALWLPLALATHPLVADAWLSPTGKAPGNRVTSTPSAERYDIAREYGARFPVARIVPYQVGRSALFDTLGTRMVSELLSFQTGQPVIRRDRRDICSQIAAIAGANEAVVVSKLSPERVRSEMARDGCAGRARVVHVPGELGDVAMLDTANAFLDAAGR